MSSLVDPPHEQVYEADVEEVARARDAFKNGKWAECVERLEGFLDRKWRKTEADQQDWARRILERRSRWFRDRLVHEVQAMWIAGEFRDKDHVDEYVEQRAGELLTHVKDAQQYLLVTTNDSACLDQLDDVPTLGRCSVAWSTMAACSLKADVVEELLEFHNINTSDEPPREKSQYCTQCSKWRPHWIEGNDICQRCDTDLA